MGKSPLSPVLSQSIDGQALTHVQGYLEGQRSVRGQGAVKRFGRLSAAASSSNTGHSGFKPKASGLSSKCLGVTASASFTMNSYS